MNRAAVRLHVNAALDRTTRTVDEVERLLAATARGDTEDRRRKVEMAELMLTGFKVDLVRPKPYSVPARDQLIGRIIDLMIDIPAPREIAR